MTFMKSPTVPAFDWFEPLGCAIELQMLHTGLVYIIAEQDMVVEMLLTEVLKLFLHSQSPLTCKFNKLMVHYGPSKYKN